jgi:hypothetical protein
VELCDGEHLDADTRAQDDAENLAANENSIGADPVVEAAALEFPRGFRSLHGGPKNQAIVGVDALVDPC